ncbi:hypothetical protein NPIL_171461, partial [Nephila pilipes]
IFARSTYEEQLLAVRSGPQEMHWRIVWDDGDENLPHAHHQQL